MAIKECVETGLQILDLPRFGHNLTFFGGKAVLIALADAEEAALEIAVVSGAFGESAFRRAELRGIACREAIETILEVVVEARFVYRLALQSAQLACVAVVQKIETVFEIAQVWVVGFC